MLVFWRGHGWAVPAIVIAVFLATHMSLDAVYGDGYFKEQAWPTFFAIIFSSVLIGLLGYFLNYKKRTVLINEETGEKKKSPSHTLFFIPVEFWAAIVFISFVFIQNSSAEQDVQDMSFISSPLVEDKYLVDLTKIFKGMDTGYKYSIVKVSAVIPEAVEVVISKAAYNKKSGPRKDIREKEVDTENYFSKNTATFSKDELIALKKNDAIYEVVRN